MVVWCGSGGGGGWSHPHLFGLHVREGQKEQAEHVLGLLDPEGDAKKQVRYVSPLCTLGFLCVSLPAPVLFLCCSSE